MVNMILGDAFCDKVEGVAPKIFLGGLAPRPPPSFAPHFIYPRHAAALHSDGTSKKGRSFITYDIVKDDGECLMTGPREIAIGDSGTQLKVLQESFFLQNFEKKEEGGTSW